MSDRVFSVLSEFIHSHCGIKMPPGKKTMLEGRLRKRLRALDIESFETYCNYLFNSKEMQQELISMLDVVTTNKTDFFRESSPFRPAVGKSTAGICETSPQYRHLECGLLYR